MRFLILTQYFPPEVGAPQTRLASFARELAARGHRVEIVTALPNYPTGRILPGYGGRFYQRDIWEGHFVHRVWLMAAKGAGIARLANYVSFAVTCLVGLFRAKRPDVLFVESPPLFLSVPAWVASRIWHVPMVFNVADLWPDSVRELGLMRDGWFLKAAARLERWSYRTATYVNAVTEGIRYVLQEKKGVPARKVLFLPNGVDLQVFRPVPYDDDLAGTLDLRGRKVILYAGTLGFAHGVDTALEAARLTLDTNITWVFLGDGSEKRRLVKTAKDLALTNVRFLDPVPPEQVAQLYGLSVAGLSTLRSSPLFEGTRPVKIFACMASAKPILYSGAGEGARLVEDARAGIVTPPEDAKALAHAARALLDGGDLSARLGDNARRYVAENLSWDRLVAAWVEEFTKRERVIQ